MSTRLEGMARNLATADAFAGKKVVDNRGISYGKVRHIHVDSDSLAVAGVTISYGFRKAYYLPREFIEKFTAETLLLSKSPVRKGSPVVDIDGHKVGKVKELHRNKGTGMMESITVSHGLLSKRVVDKSEIWGVGESVILKATEDEFFDQE